MRRSFRIAGFALAASLWTTLFTCTALAATGGVIVGNNVNLRSAPNTSAGIVGTVTDGTPLDLVGESVGWYQVSYNETDSAFVAEGYFKITMTDGIVMGDSVNVRTSPSVNAPAIKQLQMGDSITVVGQGDEWYQLAYLNNGQPTYVSKDYLSGPLLGALPAFTVPVQEEPAPESDQATENTYGIVNASSGLRMRSTPSEQGDVVEVLNDGSVLDITQLGNEWVGVSTSAGARGYVHASYLSVRTGERPSQPTAPSNKGQEVVAYAKQFLGTPYVWGGTDLNSGVDCSGFVYSVMKHFGVNLNRTSRNMASNGIPVDKANLVAGDLILFDTSGGNGISHVGIYIGSGQYIHSTSGKAYSVIISDLSSAYSQNTYHSARRVLQ